LALVQRAFTFLTINKNIAFVKQYTKQQKRLVPDRPLRITLRFFPWRYGAHPCHPEESKATENSHLSMGFFGFSSVRITLGFSLGFLFLK